MNPNDTIGLTDFLVLVFNFFKRNLLIIAITTIVGIGVSVAYTSQKGDFYSTELVGFSNVLDKTTLLEILNPLSVMVEEKNYSEIARKFDISTEEAAQIKTLDFTESRHLVTSHAPKATDKKLGELILIKATVYDQSILDKLSSGVIHYLNENPYINNTHQLMLQKNETLIAEMTRNIALIDSLNRSGLDKKGTAVSFQQSQNPINYGEAIYMLEDLKIATSTLTPFTVVSPFFEAAKPSNRNVLTSGIITIAFFITSLLIVFVKELAQLASKQ